MAKAEKDRQRQIQDKCQRLLTQMLRDEDNKYCVDCDAKGPRWASWNLGIFLCIRCAGIHRNLGVHISKVKSVNLDSWTPEQVVSLEQMGNSRARAVYEANLPDSFRRPQTDSALESFIRAKYEGKKYIAQEWVPPVLPKVNWDKELDEEAEKARKKKREVKSTVPIAVAKKIDAIPQALPKPHSSPKNRDSKSSRSREGVGVSAPPSSAADLLGLDTPTTEAQQSNEDVFTSFLSAAPVKKRSQEEESFFNQSLGSDPAAAGSGGKLTTDSILALYSKGPPIPLSQPAQGHAGMFGAQAIQQFPYTSPLQPVPAVGGSGPPPLPPGSNPFYSMQQGVQAQQHMQGQPQQQFQQADVSGQLAGLSLNPSGQPKFQISNQLWH